MYLTENNNSVNVNDPDYKYGLNFATLLFTRENHGLLRPWMNRGN